MALYNLEKFKALVRAGEWDYLNRRRTLKNLDKLQWSDDDLLRMLYALSEQRNFQKTVPDCKVNDCNCQDYVHADQYEIHWDEDQGVSQLGPMPGTISLSLKIAILNDDAGEFSGIVVFHTSPEP